MICADEEVAIEVASYPNESLQTKNLVSAARSGLPPPLPNSERSMRHESIESL